ncbi:hypothetical protein LAZ67_10002715 [Cordylochernes scorpioides]|uniref:CCHC-type domain-containing protein n=1 Tax=Cordylochernes scorpioides TaxID=51811 RepID=A0ABY6KWT7_9ARAC|nr:hypothetical protein LAZ67_10002715 [Cordylochernes scorpioides]
MELSQYYGGGGGSQQANKRPRSEDEDLLPSSHHQFKFNSTANLFNFECQTFEAIIADTSLDSPEKIQMATKGLILTLVQEAELLLKDAFKGASLGRPNPTANVPIPSTSFASVVAEKDKPVKPAPPKPKAKSTFVNLAPSFELHVVVSCPECPVILPRYCLFRVDGEVRDDEICESFRSNHSVQSLLEKREIRVVHRSNNAAHSTSTVFIEVDNQVAEILGQHGRIPVAGLVHRYERSHTLKQCFRCCGFGHRASACPAAHPICYRCGSAEHEGIRCSVEPSQSRCCRCRKKIWSSHNHFATLSTCAYIPSGIVARSNLHPIPLTSPDTAITSIAICLEQSIIMVHSAYWHGLRAADDFIPLLEDTIRRASLPVILGMDTNAHSPTWGIGARLDFRGANLEEFASFNDLHFLGPPVDSTWSNGPLSSSIDVTLASSSLAIHATRGLLGEMDFTDHIPIWTTFLDMVNNETNSSWVESSCKEQTFKSFLNSSLHQQKLCRLATCEDMLEMTRTDPEWKDKIITGDETWVYGYDPETKPQSAEWREDWISGSKASEWKTIDTQGGTLSVKYYEIIFPDLGHDKLVGGEGSAIFEGKPSIPYMEMRGTGFPVQFFPAVATTVPTCTEILPQSLPVAIFLYVTIDLDRFKEGREETTDNERSGRPSTSTPPEKVDKVLELVREDRRITVREAAEEAGISFGLTQSIMKDIFGVKRLNAVLVSKDLAFDQKNARKETASLNLEATTDDPELLKRVITGDETWIYGFDSETTQQASEWRFKNEPRPKKARKALSKVKVMLTVFFDYQGIVHHEFQQQGSTITADSHLGVLRRLREAIRLKRPELWRSKSCILHHDNAPAHTALKISKFLQDHSTSVFPQPPYNPDLAPCEFFLFEKLKKSSRVGNFRA